MTKYMKKLVIIEAIQWTGHNAEEIIQFSITDKKPKVKQVDSYLVINTLEGSMLARLNDYIIKGVKGEFYPCKPDIFEETYQKVEDIQL